MTTYVILSDNELVGVGKGGTITDAQLEGWDIPHLLKTGILDEVTPSKPSKEKE